MKRFLHVFFVLFCLACDSSVIFEQYREIPEEVWSRYNVLEFKTVIADSGLYDITVCVRHTTDYEMTDLWCFISVQGSSLKEIRDSVSVEIATSDGRWLGQGYNIKTVEQRAGKSPLFFPKGEVAVRVEQGMERELMKGIKDIGIKISAHGKE